MTRAEHQQRYNDVLRAFDGSNEVRVRVSGTGLSVEQIVWLARCHGYDIWEWDVSRGGPSYLIMRRIDQRNAQSVSEFGAPHSGNAYVAPVSGSIPQPSLKDLQAIRRDVYRTGNRNGRFWGILVFAGVGVTSAYHAAIDYQAGNSYALEIAISVMCIAGAIAGGVITRSFARRRDGRFRQGEMRGD